MRVPRRRCATAMRSRASMPIAAPDFAFARRTGCSTRRCIASCHPDLRDEVLQADGNVNGYDHYLKHGSREGRIGHLLFDPAVYLAQLDQAETLRQRRLGRFRTICDASRRAGRKIRTSLYFDPVWYLQQYPSCCEGDRARRMAMRTASLSVQRHALGIRSVAGILRDVLPDALSGYRRRRWRRRSGATATIISSAMACWNSVHRTGGSICSTT